MLVAKGWSTATRAWALRSTVHRSRSTACRPTPTPNPSPNPSPSPNPNPNPNPSPNRSRSTACRPTRPRIARASTSGLRAWCSTSCSAPTSHSMRVPSPGRRSRPPSPLRSPSQRGCC
eukprot:scaffold82196_cov42-Phaeocystis_antarctica.AAC.2